MKYASVIIICSIFFSNYSNAADFSPCKLNIRMCETVANGDFSHCLIQFGENCLNKNQYRELSLFLLANPRTIEPFLAFLEETPKLKKVAYNLRKGMIYKKLPAPARSFYYKGLRIDARGCDSIGILCSIMQKDHSSPFLKLVSRYKVFSKNGLVEMVYFNPKMALLIKYEYDMYLESTREEDFKSVYYGLALQRKTTDFIRLLFG